MKALIRFAFAITSVIIHAQNTTSYSETAAIKSDSLLKELVVKHKSVGAVAGISINDSILWKSAYGYMDQKNDKKANTAMKTRIASLAKPMTAIAVMQLFEKGVIALDEPVKTYVKEFPSLSKNEITIRQLLNHTSGIKGYASSKEAESKKNYSTLTEAMHVFIDRETHGPPGTSYNYTSYGYVVLGVVIERITGVSFEDYMKKNIWQKAGMNTTGIEKLDETYENKSELYSKKKNGKVKHIANGNNLSNRIPGGGFYSTLDDMLKFGQAVLNHSLIKEETLLLMLHNNKLRKKGSPYGLGWFMYGASPNPERVFGHGGAQTGASADLLLIPSQQKVIVVLSNTSRVGETIGTAVGIHNNYKIDK